MLSTIILLYYSIFKFMLTFTTALGLSNQATSFILFCFFYAFIHLNTVYCMLYISVSYLFILIRLPPKHLTAHFIMHLDRAIIYILFMSFLSICNVCLLSYPQLYDEFVSFIFLTYHVFHLL